MITVQIDTSPLQNANATRGVGMYTQFLSDELAKRKDVTVSLSSTENLAQKPDLIHYPFFDLFFHTLPLKRVAKTVVTIHDVIPLIFPEQYEPGVKGRLRFFQQKLALKTVAAVITDSKASQKDIARYLRFPVEKIHVTYLAGNPLIHKTVESRVQHIRRKYHISKQYILYVGDINYNKNILQLIKSLKYLPEELQLVCVGKNFQPQPIPEWQVIEAQLALSDVAARVVFVADLGKDATEDVSALYSGAVAYVQPSLYEGFGLPVLEAMQAETPVVSAQNSSLIEVGGNCVVFAEPAAEFLAAGVKEVLGWTKSDRAQKLQKAVDWSQKFSWTKTADQTVQVYQKVLGHD